MPTILEICNLPIPTGIQGQSMVPLLAAEGGAEDKLSVLNEGWKAEPAVSENLVPEQILKTYPELFLKQSHAARAIILDGWKLIYYIQPPNGHPALELFNHRDDPLDQHNLAEERSDIVELLLNRLEEWEEDATVSRFISDSQGDKELSPEQLEQLRALGYLR